MPEIFDRVLVLNLVANTAIFYVAARLYLLPLISRVRPQQILVPDIAFAFNSTPGNVVPDARRDFSGFAIGVRVSGSIWRSDNGSARSLSNSAGVARFRSGQADGVVV